MGHQFQPCGPRPIGFGALGGRLLLGLFRLWPGWLCTRPGQVAVGLVDKAEQGTVAAHVGVDFFGQISIGLFDFVFTGVPRQAQQVEGVFSGHRFAPFAENMSWYQFSTNAPVLQGSVLNYVCRSRLRKKPHPVRARLFPSQTFYVGNIEKGADEVCTTSSILLCLPRRAAHSQRQTPVLKDGTQCGKFRQPLRPRFRHVRQSTAPP